MVVGCWRGYLCGARCRLVYGPADATATHVSCFSKIQIGFTFLVPAHLGSPGQRAVKWVRVCVCNVFNHDVSKMDMELQTPDTQHQALYIPDTCLVCVIICHRHLDLTIS